MTDPIQRRRRRAFIPLFVVLFIGLVLFLQYSFGSAEVMAEYVLSGDRTGIDSLQVKWRGDNDKEVEATFKLDPNDPGRFRHQTLALPRGHYNVELRVSRTDLTSQSKSFEVDIEGEQSVSFEINLTR